MFEFVDDIQTEAVQGILAGFAFVTANSYANLVEFLVSNLFKTQDGALFLTSMAVITTLISFVVYFIMKRLNSNVKKVEITDVL